MRSYHLYGLRLRSHWPLPYEAGPLPSFGEVSLVDGWSPARAGAFAEAARTDSEDTGRAWFHLAECPGGDLYLRWDRLVEFLISADGREIAARPLASSSSEAFHTYLLGQALSYALVKQGFEPIHATVVTIDGSGVAFLGDCGLGKSTLAAAFLQAGHRVLTDDQLVLTRRDEGFAAHPGPPRIKLFPAIARRCLGAQHGGTRITPQSPKLVVPLEAHHTAGAAAPLKAIYVLGRSAGDTVTIRRLSQRRACLALFRNTFNTRVTNPARLQRLFASATSLAATLPVKVLSYPRALRLLPAVREAVLADLAR